MQFRVSFDANIARKERIFVKLLREKYFFQIFAVPKRTFGFPEGRNSSAVEHFTRNEGVPSSNLGFGSNNQEITVYVISFFMPFGEEKQDWNGDLRGFIVLFVVSRSLLPTACTACKWNPPPVSYFSSIYKKQSCDSIGSPIAWKLCFWELCGIIMATAPRNRKDVLHFPWISLLLR